MYFPQLSSDHNPVIVKIADKITHKNKNIQPKYNFKAANWRKFNELLNESINLKPNINNSLDIDNYLTELDNNII